MATLVLAVLSLAAFGTAMVHGSTTTLEITASDKDTGSWLAKMGDTKVAVEHKHLEGNSGSGEWRLKLSQSSDLNENNDISEDKTLQQRDIVDYPSYLQKENQMISHQGFDLFSASAPGPNSWEFQQRTLPETLTPTGVYQDSSYLPIRLESLSAPDNILRPPPALPAYSYNMISAQTQPLSYPYTPSLAPTRIQREFMAAPLQPYNTLRYESQFPAYNVPAYDPAFEANGLERAYVHDVIQPNAIQHSYLPLRKTSESSSMSVPLQQDVSQQDFYMPGAFAGQQHFSPQNGQRFSEPLNPYQYTAVIIPDAEEVPSVNQNTGKTEYSSEVPNREFISPDSGMDDMQNQRAETRVPFLYASNSMLNSINAAPQEQQITDETNNPTPNSVPEKALDSGYESDANTEEKYIIIEALGLPNSETPPVQELSRGDNLDQPLPYSPNFAPRVYSEEIEGLKAPQPLPLVANERVPDAPQVMSDYSAPSYGMTPPPRFEQRSPNENEVIPEYKEVQDYHPYIADIAFKPIQEVDSAISYMPTSILKQEETVKTDAATQEVAISSENQK